MQWNLRGKESDRSLKVQKSTTDKVHVEYKQSGCNIYYDSYRLEMSTKNQNQKYRRSERTYDLCLN